MPRHQSLDRKVKKKLFQLQQLAGVKKLVIASSKSHRTAGRPQSFVKVQGATTTGFKLLAYGERGVQELYLHLLQPADTTLRHRVLRWIAEANEES